MQIQERRVRTRGITFHVREAGRQGRAILFFHGITANAAVWDPVLALLDDAFRVIAVDQRGHGKSDKPATGYGPQNYAQDIVDLVNALGGEPALLVGHSLGARNAIEAAARFPEIAAGVVAIDFTPFIEPEVMRALETRVKGGDRTFASRAEIESYLSDRYPLMPPDAVARRALHGYREEEGQFLPLADPAAVAATVTGLRLSLEPAMLAVRKPVLLVRGAESKLVSATAFDRTRRLRPDLPALSVPGADHYVPEEAPLAVADAVRAFANGL
jgi:2-(acetamidomethylene)succinate hydrolase